jgi:alpha-beta hydrolase superfamily lysophospholipase
MISPQFSLPASRPIPAEILCRTQPLILPDGYRTSVVRIDPDEPDPAQPPVVVFHGIQSHPGWFIGSASALARRGMRVYLPVRRGSGDNTARPGDAASPRQLLDDVTAAIDWARCDTACEHIRAVGISWGGKLLAAWALRDDAQAMLAGLTLVAPGICPQVDVPLATKLAIAACLLLRPGRRFEIPLSDPALFTDDEQFRAYLRDDPCRLTRATARFLLASRMLDRRLAKAPQGALPPATLLLSATDRIIDNERSRQSLHRLTGNRLRITEVDAPHTMEFTHEPSSYYQALIDAVTS